MRSHRSILLTPIAHVCLLASLVASGLSLASRPVQAADIDALTQTIRSVQVDGTGNRQAAVAWQELAENDADTVVTILEAFQGANPLAANWLQTAVDAIAERTLAEDGQLPLQDLEMFVKDSSQNPRARRIAYEWLVRQDDTTPDRLLPQMLDDPSVELRRDAVARVIDAADQLEKAGETEEAAQRYREALNAARDFDQIQRLAKQLRAMNQEVDLPTHYGFLMQWKTIGPFDNSDRAGFDTVYPPEKKAGKGQDFTARYDGKEDTVGWQSYRTDDDYGMVDFNDPYGDLKEVTAYAWTDFVSEQEQPVELRLGCKNAFKVWLNGELLLARDEYHRGMKLDQYVMPAILKAGKNEILVKACQNEQMQSWTKEWQFQLRVCDATGTAILSQSRRSPGAQGAN